MSALMVRQYLAGRDFARGHQQATQMQNFAYLVICGETKEAVLIDPAWDVAGLLALADAEGVKVTGVLATHAHPDHIGGSWLGLVVEGVVELLAKRPLPLHCHRAEAELLTTSTGITADRLTPHDSGDVITVGHQKLELLHTPGHTQGSCCFFTDDLLFSGDTLFLSGCGRVDLPGGDPKAMRESLSVRLAGVSDHTELYPGHAYGGFHAPMGEVRRTNRSLASYSR